VILFHHQLLTIFECEHDYLVVCILIPLKKKRVFLLENPGLLIDKSSCNKCHSKRKIILQFACFNLNWKYLRTFDCRLFLLGALSYTAPEIFEEGEYTIQSDIYSFGCILLDMITCDTLTVRYDLKILVISCWYRMKRHYNYVFVLDMMLVHCRKLFRIWKR
jgi:serine/threonine protein kinase